MNEHDQNIDAIHERDLDKFLKQEKLFEKFENSEILCKFCRTEITRDNLYSILPESGAFNFICSKSECVAKLMEYIDSKAK
tara:strand:- start:6955 stop:7197 length:243 start_codon:yes stop_codon:yes gene_type:complete